MIGEKAEIGITKVMTIIMILLFIFLLIDKLVNLL
ncbi:hypothetical protein cce_2165 [Crocosphaera subtropica ATCC 51142]|uniref:Uncharacterized protein n=1 Tax=Crocosphaera subtropica (strain ATCC 51142 / BH68) TaxID=43989 RepID=B1WNT6_CROS5|nr:hypothetical protein cce_2165 [Crocosphaera subtropica ATCC 51142]